MNTTRTLSEWMQELDLDVPQLAASSGLDAKVVQAIVAGRYTTSPRQRERIASAIGISVDDVQWTSAAEVDHMYGHGPQFGRSP